MYAPSSRRLAQCCARVGACATQRDASRRHAGGADYSSSPEERGQLAPAPARMPARMLARMLARNLARTQSSSTSGKTSTADAGGMPSASRIFRFVSMRHGHPDSTLSIVSGLTPARRASSALLIIAR